MSEDSSSPTEAAIADRRLKVLMNKHDMSIAEIKLHINGTAISAMPDTSSLWQDFKIIGTNVTDGPDAQDFRIQMLLQPRRTGTLMIPSFRVDEVRSELIIVEVLKRN